MAEPAPLTIAPRSHAAVPASFAQAYRDFAPQVARWAARLAGAACDVEDIVQEVFWVVSRKLPTIREDGNFTAWLFQVTRKIAANYRRRASWRRLWGREDDLAELGWSGLGPDAELERKRTIALFHRALDRLPEKQRTVFVLYELEGMATAEIAALVDRNLSTVKVQLVRARARFVGVYRRLLRKACAGDGVTLSQLAHRLVSADAELVPPVRKETS